jgi:hypothetical protein
MRGRRGRTRASRRLNGGPINKICSLAEIPEKVDKQFLNIAKLARMRNEERRK